MELTWEELIHRLHYDPNTGNFYWVNPNSTKTKVGDVAGTKLKTGYVNITVNRTFNLAHRLAWFYMTGEWPNGEIDHINGIRDDNRWCNLRIANKQQNHFNEFRSVNNTSGCKNVYWDKARSLWLVSLTLNGKQYNFGRFKDYKEAVNKAYEKRKEFFGDYSNYE